MAPRQIRKWRFLGTSLLSSMPREGGHRAGGVPVPIHALGLGWWRPHEPTGARGRPPSERLQPSRAATTGEPHGSGALPPLLRWRSARPRPGLAQAGGPEPGRPPDSGFGRGWPGERAEALLGGPGDGRLETGVVLEQRRKSATSRERSWHWVRVVTVAVRTVSRMRAISPKYWPRPSWPARRDVHLDLARHDEVHRVCRIAGPDHGDWAGTMAFRSLAISAIRAASRPVNSGTFGDRLPGDDEVTLADLAREIVARIPPVPRRPRSRSPSPCHRRPCRPA